MLHAPSPPHPPYIHPRMSLNLSLFQAPVISQCSSQTQGRLNGALMSSRKPLNPPPLTCEHSCASVLSSAFPHCPTPTSTLLPYSAFLARSKWYTSVIEYLDIIRIIHQEFGYNNPIKDNWQLSSLLRGIKHGKGVTVSPKAPLMPEHLSQILDMLRLDRLADL